MFSSTDTFSHLSGKHNSTLPESSGKDPPVQCRIYFLSCLILVSTLMWYKTPWVQFRGKKNPIYKSRPRLLVPQHPNYPVSRFLFIHADKVTYSWGLTQNSLIDWQAQIAYFTIWGKVDAFTLRRWRESKMRGGGTSAWAFGSLYGQFR